MSARRAAVLALLVAGLSAGCGVPTGDAPATIPPSDVPYGLLSTTPSSAPATSPAAPSVQPQVFFIDGDGRLVARGRALAGGPLKKEFVELLDDLASGPSREERRNQLSSALPPDVRLTLTGYDAGTVTIDIVGSTDLAGRASRLAVGQLVLTATSLPGIDAVLLRRNGEPVEAPLPDGQLTTDPLTATGYLPLTQAPPS